MSSPSWAISVYRVTMSQASLRPRRVFELRGSWLQASGFRVQGQGTGWPTASPQVWFFYGLSEARRAFEPGDPAFVKTCVPITSVPS